MELELRNLTDPEEIGRIYREHMTADFPRNELKPLAMILAALERDSYACRALCAGEELLGYAFFFLVRRAGGDLWLFDYFAIVPERRDTGLGSEFLRLLRGAPDGAACVVGEVEDPDAAPSEAARETRERRLRFYLRNGARDAGLKARVYGVDYRVLELPGAEAQSTDALREAYTALYRAMLPPDFFREQFLVKN